MYHIDTPASVASGQQISWTAEYMVKLEPIRTRETDWEPCDISVPLQLALDACFVPSATGDGLRVDEAHVVVIGANAGR
jgi:hypothetical protein